VIVHTWAHLKNKQQLYPAYPSTYLPTITILYQSIQSILRQLLFFFTCMFSLNIFYLLDRLFGLQMLETPVQPRENQYEFQD